MPFLLSIFCVFLLFAFTHPEAKVAKIKFLDSRIIQLGNVNEGDVVRAFVRYKNVGNAPLTFTSVTKTCNCTSVDYQKQPLAPSKTGIVTVSVNTSRKVGSQVIVVTLKPNVPDKTVIIRVNMNVISAHRHEKS